MPGALIQRIRKAGYYIPFTAQFLVFSGLLVAGFFYLNRVANLPESSFRDIFKLLLLLAIAFSSLFLCVGFISVILSYGFFKWQQVGGRTNFTITGTSTNKGAVRRVHVVVSPLLRPLLGFVKLRLRHDGEHFTKKFAIATPGMRSPLSTSLDGVYYWDLPEIREFNVSHALIYFEDFFQFFSFAISVEATGSFANLPHERDLEPVSVSPRKTDETTVRIEQLKKVEGELINYKNFESNDDVRRIVWKIYARNKELVVRIPEILDPFASHLYFYGSFHSQFSELNPLMNGMLLDFYKIQMWSCYQAFRKKGYEVRFRTEQLNGGEVEDNPESVRKTITGANWQQEVSIGERALPKDVSAVMVSSLNTVEDVEHLLDQQGMTVVFVPLSEAVRSSAIGSWLKWVFVEEADREQLIRRHWTLSAFRARVIANEKKIQKVLEKYQTGIQLQSA